MWGQTEEEDAAFRTRRERNGIQLWTTLSLSSQGPEWTEKCWVDGFHSEWWGEWVGGERERERTKLKWCERKNESQSLKRRWGGGGMDSMVRGAKEKRGTSQRCVQRFLKDIRCGDEKGKKHFYSRKEITKWETYEWWRTSMEHLHDDSRNRLLCFSFEKHVTLQFAGNTMTHLQTSHVSTT